MFYNMLFDWSFLSHLLVVHNLHGHLIDVGIFCRSVLVYGSIVMIELRASRSTEKQCRMECICFSSCKPRYVLEAFLVLTIQEKFRRTFLINQARFCSEITRY